MPSAGRSRSGAQRRAFTAASTRARSVSTVASATATSCGFTGVQNRKQTRDRQHTACGRTRNAQGAAYGGPIVRGGGRDVDGRPARSGEGVRGGGLGVRSMIDSELTEDPTRGRGTQLKQVRPRLIGQ